MRKMVRKTQKDLTNDLLMIFELDAGYRQDNEAKALEPIDDLFDSIAIFKDA
jgi:hypothetical protein